MTLVSDEAEQDKIRKSVDNAIIRFMGISHYLIKFCNSEKSPSIKLHQEQLVEVLVAKLIMSRFLSKQDLLIGTDLVRNRERSAGIQGIDETRSAEGAWWIGCLKPDGILGDVFLGFRFPASPQMCGRAKSLIFGTPSPPSFLV